MKQSTTRKENENIWRDRLERFASRPGTVTEFCEREGISKVAIAYWRRRFEQSHPSAIAVRVQSRQPKASPFSRVEILDHYQSRAARAVSRLPDAKWLAELINHLQSGGAV
jgi:transposase-like protein